MQKLKLSKWKILLPPVVVPLLVLAYLEYAHYYNYGHLFSYGLHVDVLSEDFNIGIPGQKKLYRAELTNYTLLPVKLAACDFITDAMMEDTELPYAVQRWDSSSNTWQTIVEANEQDFCHPTPLGKAETQLVSRQLWPSMSVSVMGSEATGARVPFKKGDVARFVVFRRIGKGADWDTSIPSMPFNIEDDVIRNEGDSYRISH